MKKFLILLVAAFMLFSVSIPAAISGTVDITFEWEQTISSDFGGWKLYFATTSGGPYNQLGADLVYSGTQQPTYTSTETITAPDNAETTYYFVVTAYDNNGNESNYSNEVSHTADFLSPGVPVNLRITITTP